jgi:hypothetical protein
MNPQVEWFYRHWFFDRLGFASFVDYIRQEYGSETDYIIPTH